ncbi:MAG: hypothetical protein HXY34_07055 [Candidatus Thorarchaeota archaeon]|nr:hypothetical protein [Candidatus Thorarchaeota archaeon]
MPKTVRVAVYDERNYTLPSYVSAALVSVNGTVMAAFLSSRGFDVTLVDASDITSHVLSTARFDVLVLPDNLPRENITNQVKEFWIGGGGVLSVDSSIAYLGYAGMLPAESEGDDGYGVYWGYVISEVQQVAALHPTTKSYDIGDNLNSTQLDWATFYWTTLSGVADAAFMTKILYATGHTDWATGVAYDPSERGGKVVQLPGYGDSIAPDLADLIADSVTWLAPVPKARVVFDMSHQPRRSIDLWDELSAFPNSYTDLRNMLVSMRFTVDKLYPSSSGNLTQNNLAPYNILILVTPDYNYTPAETSAVSAWVNAGGSLWVFGENPGLSNFKMLDDQLNHMMQGMGVQIWLDGGSSTDVTYTAKSHIINENIGDLFSTAKGFLNLTGTAQALWYQGPDVIAAVNQVGKGRLFAFADINWAQDATIASSDNEDFARNVAGWLSAAESQILLFTDETYSVNKYRTPVALALNELKLNYQLVTVASTMNLTLVQDTYELVIVDSPSGTIHHTVLTSLATYVKGGGRLLMSYYRAYDVADHQLWPLLGFLPLTPFSTHDPFYMWDPNHPVFNHPVDYGATQFDSSNIYAVEGCMLHLFDNATLLQVTVLCPVRTSLSSPSELTIRHCTSAG